MSRAKFFVLATVVAAALIAGCSGSKGDAVREGQLVGRLSTTDGAAPGETRPIPGSVMLDDVASESFQSVEVGADGRFDLRVSVGTYIVREIGCGGDTAVKVSEDEMSTVEVVCPVVGDQR